MSRHLSKTYFSRHLSIAVRNPLQLYIFKAKLKIKSKFPFQGQRAHDHLGIENDAKAVKIELQWITIYKKCLACSHINTRDLGFLKCAETNDI